MGFNAQKNASTKKRTRRLPPRAAASTDPAPAPSASDAARAAAGPRPPGCAPVTPAWSAALPTSPLYGVEAALDADHDPVVLYHVKAINAISEASAGRGSAARLPAPSDVAATLMSHSEALLAHVQQKRKTLEAWTPPVPTIEAVLAQTECLNQLVYEEREMSEGLERTRAFLAARQRQRGRA
ncbi:hypothetical protein H9P43_006795 [Blastocladiella emersonii ATCC 22665]|nr:hypothetical protein H9P43_006795 [Blastocladiella emersonii ATCC 22665]